MDMSDYANPGDYGNGQPDPANAQRQNGAQPGAQPGGGNRYQYNNYGDGYAPNGGGYYRRPDHGNPNGNYGGRPYTPPPRRFPGSEKGILALVISVAGLVFGNLVLSIIALVIGNRAIEESRAYDFENGNAQTAMTLAKIGIALGALVFVLVFCCIIFAILYSR